MINNKCGINKLIGKEKLLISLFWEDYLFYMKINLGLYFLLIIRWM